MASGKRIILLIGLVWLIGSAPSALGKDLQNKNVKEKFFNNHNVINVVDDFLAYWTVAEGQPLRYQRRLWTQMVERKHKDYFERAVYQNLDHSARRALLDRFLLLVPERIVAIREMNRLLSEPNSGPLVESLIYFCWRYPDFRLQRDIYIGLSLFRFDGSVRPVGNELGIPDTLCLGVEMLTDSKPEKVRVTVAHELFHLYHFGFLFQNPFAYDFRTPHIPLMVEGMAVAATEHIYFAQPNTLYLNFSEAELLRQRDLLAKSSGEYLNLIRENALPERYEQWFINHPVGDIPSRGGYLLGYEIVKRLLPAYSLAQMARMNVAELREHSEEQLRAMSGKSVLVVAGDRD